jgi:hypothetical protein
MDSRRRPTLVFATAVIIATTVAYSVERNGSESDTTAEISLSDIARNEVEAKALQRPIYRHSVIPGGVYSASELEDAVKNDPVAREHYKTIALNRVTVKAVAAPRDVYVSYRVGDSVYWTKGRVRLAAGESVLTDGDALVRARCGNRISTVPRTPVAQIEPPSEGLDEIVPRPGGFDLETVITDPELIVPPIATGLLPVDPGLWSPEPDIHDGPIFAGPLLIVPGLVGGGSSPGPGGSGEGSVITPPEPDVVPPLSPPGLQPLPSDETPPSDGGDGTQSPPAIVIIPLPGNDPIGGDDEGGEEPGPGEPVSVPEPSALMFVGIGAALAIARRFRR